MRGRRGAAALAFAEAGCRAVTGEEPGVVCTAVAIPGLAVMVRDSATGAALAPAGTTVLARDGAYADTARSAATVPAGAAFSLAYERAGTYTVRVERAGYRAWARTGAAVTADRCHVRTVARTALLQP